MAPLKPHWKQPSHPDIQEVIINEHEFTSKSLSKVSLPAFGLYAKMSFPPCTRVNGDEPTYATVQYGKDEHLDLNSDLLYINHSCEPSLVSPYPIQAGPIFDTANLQIIAGPNGIQAGEELTFFYPSTEWEMAQPFDCLCGKPTCRGRIGGARDMTKKQLEGLWINGHIRELLEEKAAGDAEQSENGSAKSTPTRDAQSDTTALALEDALKHAHKVVEAARNALQSYIETATPKQNLNSAPKLENGGSAQATMAPGLPRRGPTSRELSGEMGGDTIAA
ncbi:Histone-lysine N-methyltransferase ash1 [Apiospora kogelbergensis]|uniref:Histone-lysine N-methyltransferase ash1 n=1 Tax=Apiospora kogelbergensis TaxID=1337665 RepID=UPI0031319445